MMHSKLFFGDDPLLDQICSARREVFISEGVRDASIAESQDHYSWHVVILNDANELLGAVRLYVNHIGLWFVVPGARKSLVAGKLLFELIRLADLLDIKTAFATATPKHGSSAMLLRLGAKPISKSFNRVYQCEVLVLLFRMSELPENYLRRL